MISKNELTLSHNKKKFLWKFYATSFYILLFIAIFIALFYTKSLLYKNSDNQSINANVMTSDNNLSNEFRCESNPNDKCVFAPSIDFWPSGSEDNVTSEIFRLKVL
ncbi:hypothetical protein KC960_04185 [Candidatus Saccharibacteria bacterium]|nr:hypothetical protein [Candidatus Saccharibacteria bacterium]